MQERFAGWGGDAGQARLAAAMVVVVGVGALGGTSAQLLARAGVGRLRLVDPDRPSLQNLHRQMLYNEADAAAGLPKVQAAARCLAGVNSEVGVEAIEAALTPDNARQLLVGADLVLDGLDNPQGRWALNQACWELGIPWVHAGLAGAAGQLLVVRPGRGPCLACWTNRPGRGEASFAGAASHGVIGPLPACLGSLQAAEALKLLLGAEGALLRGMLLVELWPPRFRVVHFDDSLRRSCPVCGGGPA